MFSFPSHPIFLDPWAVPASRTGFYTGWDCFEPFLLEADAPCRAQARASARAGARPRRDHVSRDELDSMNAFARHAHHQAQPTQAAPEPVLRRPRSAQQQHQQQQQQQQQQQPRSNGPSTSCNTTTSSSSSSSYHSTRSNTAEPMDVCFDSATADQPKQQQQQQHGVRTIRVTTASSFQDTSQQAAHQPIIPNSPVAAEQPATELPASLEGNDEDMQQDAQQADHSDQLICSTATKPSIEVTSAAATTIQATWRMHKTTKHRSALKQLATAAGQLRDIRSNLSTQLQAAAAAGCALTQKQYLELSEPVMKVLFLLDSVSCGSVVELRNVRKRLTVTANQLLDDIQTAYKQPVVVPLQ